MKIIDDLFLTAKQILSSVKDQKLRTKQEFKLNALLAQLRTDHSSLVSLNSRYVMDIQELESKVAQLEKGIADPWLNRSQELEEISKKHHQAMKELSTKYEQKLRDMATQYEQAIQKLVEERANPNDNIINISRPDGAVRTSTMRHYVLDTSVIVQTPRIIEELIFRENKTYIPSSVLKELDKLKESADPEIAANSRKASAFIYRHAQTGKSESDRHIPSINRRNIYLYICDRYESVDELNSQTDNRILGTAVWLQMALSGKTRFSDRHNFIINEIKWRIGVGDQLILLTADTNMRFAAEKHDITAKAWKRK